MGAGPEHLLENGLGEALRSEGRRPSVTTVRPESDPTAEVATAFELDGLVSGQVRGALAEGEFPWCSPATATPPPSGRSRGPVRRLGFVWFDAHGDFNTPETTTTGFADGMGLAIAVGHCWKEMAESVPGFSPVAEENVVMAGVRDVHPAEEERLAASEVTVVGADRIEAGVCGPSRTPWTVWWPGWEGSTCTWTSTSWTP